MLMSDKKLFAQANEIYEAPGLINQVSSDSNKKDILFRQSNKTYDTPIFASGDHEELNINPKPKPEPEIKRIRTITEKKKIKIIEKKPESFKSDVSDAKPSSFQTPNKVGSAKSIEKDKKNMRGTKSFSGFMSANPRVSGKNLSWFRRCLHFLFGITRKFDRVKIFFGENAIQDPLYHHANNCVKTTKYTPLNWFPKSLLIQFMKSANIYFLIITILTAMPFSPKMPETMFLTFSAVLVFTQLKEAYEDYRRYLQDNEVNFKKVLCYDFISNSFIEKEWMNLEVGEFVKVLKEESFPADLLFLKCSQKNGIAFVDTMNLDGETNLKEKLVFAETQDLEIENLAKLKGSIECEAPNEFLDVFEGNIVLEKQGETDHLPSSLSIKQLLVRGSVLKNTSWILGLTVYCGPQTKAFKNARKPRNKMSNIIRKMNKILYSLFAFLGTLGIIWTYAGISTEKLVLEHHFYLGQNFDDNSFSYIIQRFCVYIVAYSQIIPISLYVALEIVKLMHAYLITYDPDLFYAPVSRKPFVKNSDLIEELGQVEIIFSDKTGTLTCNVMEFKKCIINDTIYGENASKKNSKLPYHISNDSRAYQTLLDKENAEECMNIDNFFRVISICHTVVTDKDESNITNIKYQASSPDELALVEGAKRMGYVFLGRDSRTLTVQVFDNEPEIWENLVEFPFDSLRKRMSMIVRNTKTGKYFIMTKGADTVMIPRIKNHEDLKGTEEKLMGFALEGLRTLVIAQKELEEKEYNEFWSEYQQLKVSSEKSKARKLLKLYALYERNLNLVGVSGIEDKLQDGVPDTIYKLIEADVRIWVLTGDKQETAIEIGKACKLIQEKMDLVILTSDRCDEVENKIKRKCEQYDIRIQKSVTSLYKLEKKGFHNRKMVLVIDGHTLNFVMKDPVLKHYFFILGIYANACICCRVSPKQKADVVKLSKSYGNWITLAIGDGANDVSMITEAHIGVGIFGKEGTQAARSADFAVCQFMHLQKLLLVHGRWNYRRISMFICYYFYKNCAMVFTEIFFAFFNGFSGQIFFLDWLPMLFNALWTSWPCIVNSLLDQDVNAEMSLKYPKLFKAGPCSFYFNFKTFWLWIGFGFWHGMCCFWLPVFFLHGSIDEKGDIESHWFVSIISFSTMMHIITVKLFLETNYYTFANLGFGFLSVILYYITVTVLNLSHISKILQPEMSGMFFHILNNTKSLLAIAAIPFIALVPDFLYIMFKKIYISTPVDAIMKIQSGKKS